MKNIKVKNQEVAIKSDRQTFERTLLVQQSRDLDIRRTLKYELGAVRHSIAKLDGSLCKSVKSMLMDFMENDIPIVPSQFSFFDGMVILQKLSLELKIVGEISAYILQRIVNIGVGRLVFFSTDQYF